MREIESDPQRRHVTPFGQRNSSSACRHSVSVSKSTLRDDREFLDLKVIAMPRKRKPATKLKNDELAKRVFPPDVHKRLKELVLALDKKPNRKAKTKA